MAWFNFTKNNNNTQKKSAPQLFSSPFQEISGNNLSLPYIDTKYSVNNFVRFGVDNAYPQLLNQLYYTSPLHSAIVDFKTNAVSGGGYEFDKAKDSKSKLQAFEFEIRLNFENLIQSMLKDLIIHSRVYFLICVGNSGTEVECHIGAEKVRKSSCGKYFGVSQDWTRYQQAESFPKYTGQKDAGKYIMAFEDLSVGQDVYPLPSYTSCANWIMLDGEMSYLQKSNIQNSIFPSFMMKFPFVPKTEEDRQKVRDNIQQAKGAKNGGKVLSIFYNSKEEEPMLDAIPINNNDQLFQATTESIDSKICQAHCIDPILMGIRVSGKLGSGSDIKQSYIIFEKNVLIPLRKKVEKIINKLTQVEGGSFGFKLNKYSIIGEEIQSQNSESEEIIKRLGSMSPLVANAIIDSMKEHEKRDLIFKK